MKKGSEIMGVDMVLMAEKVMKLKSFVSDFHFDQP